MRKAWLIAALSLLMSCENDVSTVSPVVGEHPDIPAFPGAAGFGSHTPGGRGGEVLYVTNLNEEGPGSLRAALEAEVPRTVMFNVGGTIVLNKPITVLYPYVTVAGQTAPGDGILIRNGVISFRTHDFIVRGIRFRVGDDPLGSPPGNRDGVEAAGFEAYNGIIDHCSVSWGIDENVGITQGAHDITVSWCIIAEGLRNSIHPEGEHSKGLMINHSAGRNHSLHHNLIADNVDRNPQVVAAGHIEVVNNVIYNYVFGARFDNRARVHFIGNHWIPGPDTPENRLVGVILGHNPGLSTRAYVQGNIGPGREDESGDDWQITDASVIYRSGRYLFPPTGISTQSSEEAYGLVLSEAGAFPRDAVDSRIVSEVVSGGGRIIDSQNEAGGWPIMNGGTPPADSDGDGMPDSWELAHSLDPNNPDGLSDGDGNGYTAIEDYLNGLMTQHQVILIPSQ